MKKRLSKLMMAILEHILQAYIDSRPELREQLDQEFIARIKKIHRAGNPLPVKLMASGKENV